MDFSSVMLCVGDVDIPVVNKEGSPCKVPVQVLRRVDIPAHSEQSVEVRLTRVSATNEGIVEPRLGDPDIIIAASLHNSVSQFLLLRVLNVSSKTVTLPAGKHVGDYMPVDQIHGGAASSVHSDTPQVRQFAPSTDEPSLPTHLEELATIDAAQICRLRMQRRYVNC